MGTKEKLIIPEIILEWSDWYSWDSIKKDGRRKDSVKIPSLPGVYEAKLKGFDERLTIGKTANLRWRVRDGLVKGKAKHSAGKRIRSNEDVSNIEIRWAVTDRPAGVEEELHKRHIEKFGRLPVYVKHT